MSLVLVAAAVVLVAGAGIAAYARFAPRRVPQPVQRREGPPLAVETDWTSEAGAEFGTLTESARCDLVFAVASLDDERSQRLLEHALSDPAEPVALAAAHALAGRGDRAAVDAFLAAHPGLRADRIAQALSLLDEKR